MNPILLDFPDSFETPRLLSERQGQATARPSMTPFENRCLSSSRGCRLQGKCPRKNM